MTAPRAIKVLDVHGPRELGAGLPEPEATTQDFVLVTHREFPSPTSAPTTGRECRWPGCWHGCRTLGSG